MKKFNESLGERQVLKGFTLVELLVVIAIIALLASIMLPSLSGARDAAQRVKCLSNLRQMIVCALSYESDNQGELPMWGGLGANSKKHWYNAFPPYVGQEPFGTSWNSMGTQNPISMWTCPVQYRAFPAKRTYAENSFLQRSSHPNYSALTRSQYLALQVTPGRMPVTAATMPYFLDGMLWDENDVWREGRHMSSDAVTAVIRGLFDAWFPHQSGTNIGFLDGHVALVGADEPLWSDFARRPKNNEYFAW